MKAPVAGTLFFILAGLLLTAAPAQAVIILVDDDQVQCPSALFNTIQAAINAASPADIVRVRPGVYNEQIVLDNTTASPLTVRGDNGAIIMPSPMIANTTSLTSGDAMAAVVLIKDAAALINIQTLTIDAGSNGSAGCLPHIVGILVQNADAKVLNAAVRNAKLGAGLEGCQTGLGIFVQSGGGGTSDVTVEGTSVHDYQKNGITGNESGTFLIAKTNRVTGWGPTPHIAQNGIQIG
jgi:pectin methylesterase-like acyl-CoA thioesterase